MGLESLEIDASTLAVLNELSSIQNAPVKTVLERAVDNYRRTVPSSPLAPDGLPWPPGYFDRAPRKTFDEALKEYGVRPNQYIKGWPVYTAAETTRPEYKGVIPEEAPELEQLWKDEWEAWQREKNNSTDTNSE